MNCFVFCLSLQYLCVKAYEVKDLHSISEKILNKVSTRFIILHYQAIKHHTKIESSEYHSYNF